MTLVKPTNMNILEIQTKNEAGAMVVAIAGRLDTVTAPQFERTMDELIAGGEIALVIDFDGLDYISSAGLRGLLVTARKLKGAGGQVRFANVRGMVKGVFDISGFGSILPVDDSVAAALDRIAAV